MNDPAERLLLSQSVFCLNNRGTTASKQVTSFAERLLPPKKNLETDCLRRGKNVAPRRKLCFTEGILLEKSENCLDIGSELYCQSGNAARLMLLNIK
jgi:hypothetical protein